MHKWVKKRNNWKKWGKQQQFYPFQLSLTFSFQIMGCINPKTLKKYKLEKKQELFEMAVEQKTSLIFKEVLQQLVC